MHSFPTALLAVSVLSLGACSRQAPASSMITLRGTVLDSATSHPLAGALIQLRSDRSVSTTADPSGAFLLRVPRPLDGRLQLQVRFIGFTPALLERPLTQDSTQSVGQIRLVPSTVQLEDLVVTGHPPDTAALRRRKAAKPSKP